ncbi:MAG TPA: flagellar protein FlgN [Burkholderiaceae bacterium]
MSTPLENLTAEHRTMLALVALMQQEQQCLIAADVEQIAALTEQKQTLLTNMANFAADRAKALAAAGLPADDSGMQSWLAAHDDATRAVWQQLLDLTARAKELNRVNGILINKHLSSTQGALQALQIHAEDGVYGADGQTSGGTGKRISAIG